MIKNLDQLQQIPTEKPELTAAEDLKDCWWTCAWTCSYTGRIHDRIEER